MPLMSTFPHNFLLFFWSASQHVRLLLGVAVTLCTLWTLLSLGPGFLIWTLPLSEALRSASIGAAALWMVTIVVSLPPLLGYSSCVAIAGFVYGTWHGWALVASATVIGSLISFILTRHFFHSWAHWMRFSDLTQLGGLANDAAQDGILSIARVRMSPFPYSMVNGVLATTSLSLAAPMTEKFSMLDVKPSINILNFGLATILTTPRLAAYTFATSRLATVAKGLDVMDGSEKAIEFAYMLISIGLAMASSYCAHRAAEARVARVVKGAGDVVQPDV